MHSRRIGFVSLGCPKALVDSERIITQLRVQGYEMASAYSKADLVIVNTCGFIESAVEESLSTIQEALAENGKVIVTGCLGVKADMIRERCPGVLHISGPQSYESVVQAVNQQLPPPEVDQFTSLVPPQGVKLTPRHYAYLKISEGCNHRCTFCIIPSMRGKLVSRPLQEVIAEAKKLAAAGVKELLVISQDTSAYGIDLKYADDTRFIKLCEELGQLGIWVRLHYVYPYPHVDQVIPLMAEGKVLPYLDIPFQHASEQVLRLMKRPAHSDNILQRIRQWREICPEITIRSTFIVGFPGETEEDFEQLLEFLKIAELDRVGCFKYSPVAGAKANQLPNPVAADIQQQRYQRFMECQMEISRRKLQRKIGQELTVLIDQVDQQGAIARSMADAPEIDGLVYVEDGQKLKIGDFVKAIIVDSSEHDLYGTIQAG
ncbi:MAG: 30S ribosomal protein S12 methylthiotransferase RimO [Proteobacteria bacterium]|nr:30S ribosomal protein S12 methylthiotransferase RimO [Pseudomonadota bacterium]